MMNESGTRRLGFGDREQATMVPWFVSHHWLDVDRTTDAQQRFDSPFPAAVTTDDEHRPVRAHRVERGTAFGEREWRPATSPSDRLCD